MDVTTSLGAVAAVGGAGGIKGLLVSFGPFILIIIVMYFLLFRSQQKKAKQRREMLNAVRSGDKVVTAGGIIGTVSAVKEKVISLKIAENVKVEVNRSSITGVIERYTS